MRRLLGYHTRTQVHAFLKEHGVYLITALWIWSTTGKPVMPSRYYQPHDRYCRYEPAEYLALIQQADLLSRLFGRVLISPAVF
ncbi:MAG: hypothetical protein ACJ73N_07935 [Bryobacteraceae bacterium]